MVLCGTLTVNPPEDGESPGGEEPTPPSTGRITEWAKQNPGLAAAGMIGAAAIASRTL